MKYISYPIYLIFIGISIMTCGCGSASVNTKSSQDFYKIGHKSISVKDLEQDDYSIGAELFYPSKNIEDENSIESGKFPLVIFAHGYQLAYDNYRYIWESLVPKGYILAFLTTQVGVTIDIDSYADDIITLQNELLNTSSTILSGHISEKSALMGHSTGGGAIYLAQAKKPQADTLISLAALGEPYGPISGTAAIDVVSSLKTSTLILSGDKDCITPMDIHQIPLYNSFAGEKSMIVIEGGDHCGFTDSIKCSSAETLSCGIFFQGTTISQTQQHALSLEHIILWLDGFL